MTKEQIKELENLSKEALIANLVITTAQYQAVLAFAEYQAEQLAKQNEPKHAYVVGSDVQTVPSDQTQANSEKETD